MYSKEERRYALEQYKKIGSIKATCKKLGYPERSCLANWIAEEGISRAAVRSAFDKEAAREEGWHRHYPERTKAEARNLHRQGLSNLEIAEKLELRDEAVLYYWFREEKRPKMELIPTPVEPGDGKPFEGDKDARIKELELENAILRGVVDILKVVSLDEMANREKTLLANKLRQETDLPLREIIASLRISKSSYEYQRKALLRPDKYLSLREAIHEEFASESGGRGYRFVWANLRKRKEPIKVSEKVVLRLMGEEGLYARCHKKRRRKYNSYVGEVSAAPENLVKRNFHADKPNEKWLTDITEFKLSSGGSKVYLSPILDCFDGKLVSWRIDKHPTAQMANSMLEDAIATLSAGERPIIHSDRGGHYRWARWIEICDEAGLKRSMSKKACSPDNSAMEGFFGRLKNEFFYYRDWHGVSSDQFMIKLDEWLTHYNETRIKQSLGWLSPVQYRLSRGLVA